MLIATYRGKKVNDPDVRLRAPIDIFAAIGAIQGLLTHINHIERENNELRHRLPAIHATNLLPEDTDDHYERDEGELETDGSCPCGCDDPDQPPHRCVYAGTKYSGQIDKE